MQRKLVLDLYYEESNKTLLLTFPFSGAIAQSSSIFKKYLPKHINLSSIQYPGRGHLASESLINDIDEMISVLYEPVLDCISKYSEVVIYGHSLGGLVAYELLNDFYKKNVNIQNCYLNIGACPEPDLIGRRTHLHTLPDDIFWEKIKNYGGTPQLIIEDNEFKSFFLPILKADFTIYETYSWKQGEKKSLPVPIKILGGLTDKVVKIEELPGWQGKTNQQFDLIQMPGGHFFLIENPELTLSKILENGSSYNS